jgi:hypothetical protein
MEVLVFEYADREEPRGVCDWRLLAQMGDVCKVDIVFEVVYMQAWKDCGSADAGEVKTSDGLGEGGKKE